MSYRFILWAHATLIKVSQGLLSSKNFILPTLNIMNSLNKFDIDLKSSPIHTSRPGVSNLNCSEGRDSQEDLHGNPRAAPPKLCYLQLFVLDVLEVLIMAIKMLTCQGQIERQLPLWMVIGSYFQWAMAQQTCARNLLTIRNGWISVDALHWLLWICMFEHLVQRIVQR